MSRGAVGWVLFGLLVSACPAAGQSLYGQAEWVADRSTTTFGGGRAFNKLFTQSYTVGYRSVLWDPRLADYNAELTYQRSALNLSGTSGSSDGLGYRFGINLFPYRPFALSIDALRTTNGYRGLYPGDDPLSAALGLPQGWVPDRFTTTHGSFGLGWQLLVPKLPAVAINYRRDSMTTKTGPYGMDEKGRSFDVSVDKSTDRFRNYLTYNRQSVDNRPVVSLNRRQEDLLYNFSAVVNSKVRANARAGYRNLASPFGTPALVVDSGFAPTAFEPMGEFRTYFANSSLTYQPRQKVGFDVTGGYDRSVRPREGGRAMADAIFVSGGTKAEPLRGLQLSATVSSALRREELAGVEQRGTQQTAGGGVSYSFKLGPVRPSAGISRSIGRVETVEGRTGRADTLSKNGRLSVPLSRWLTVDLSADESASTDSIFSLGNHERRRYRASAQSAPSSRLRLEGSWERSKLDQGLGLDRLYTDNRTAQGSVSWALRREQHIALRYSDVESSNGSVRLRTAFSVLTYTGNWRRTRVQSELSRDTIRQPNVGTGQPTRTISYRWQGFAEYRLRLFTLGVDFQLSRTRQPLQGDYAGRQLRVRLSRRFGKAFR